MLFVYAEQKFFTDFWTQVKKPRLKCDFTICLPRKPKSYSQHYLGVACVTLFGNKFLQM